MNNFALIVVDIQKDFIVNNPVLYSQYTPFMTHVLELIEFCVQHCIPICYIQDAHKDLTDKEFRRFDPHCVEGTGGEDILNALYPLQGPVFKKSTYSGFWNTGLHEYLSSLKIDRVITIGLQTHICILSTVLNAFMLGYDNFVVEECVLSTRPVRKKYALQWMDRYSAKVVNKQKMMEIITHANC